MSSDGSLGTAVGVSYSDYIVELVSTEPHFADYVEVPFELLMRAPAVLGNVLSHAPVILHCASLSLAGNRPAPLPLVQQLRQYACESRTPWIGEHLAFLRCGGPDCLSSLQSTGGSNAPAVHPDTQEYDVGYTVSPQMTPEIAQRTADVIGRYEEQLGIPLVVENSPVYFSMPGSSLSQTDFINCLCDARPTQRLLLDIVHLQITCANFGLEPRATLQALPLERVDEIHISGHSQELDLCWDNHSRAADESTFDLLRLTLSRCTPKAITLEYNWGSTIPVEILKRDVARVRGLIATTIDRHHVWASGSKPGFL